MTLTKVQKTIMGLLIISLLSTFSFVGYKQLFGKTFKVYRDNYLEFGVENGTSVCRDCEREFYLKLKSRVKIPESYKQQYNITDNYAYSVIIPNSEYRKMWNIELYDSFGNKLDIPMQIWHLSGTTWKKYPPTTSLTLSTSVKRFKVTATLPDNIEVSGRVELKFKLFDQNIDISKDPIWWVNGNPISVETLKKCKITSEPIREYINIQAIYYHNQTICSDFPTNLSCKNFNYYNSTFISDTIYYISIVNTTTCRDTGFKIRDKMIDFEKINWNCIKDGSQICCEAPHQSNQDGVCSSGEGYCLFNLPSLKKQCTISKTRQIMDLNAE